MLFGQFFHASQGVIEEHILQNMNGQEAFYMMGWEGNWGLIFTFILFTLA
jgi:hypothetical protein